MDPRPEEIAALAAGSVLVVKPGAASVFPSINTGISTPNVTVVHGVGKDPNPTRPAGSLTVKCKGLGSQIIIFPDGIESITTRVSAYSLRGAVVDR